MSDEEEKIENTKQAMNAYNKALDVFNLKDYPTDNSSINKDLGKLLITLSKSQGKEENIKLALECFSKA